MTRGSSHLRIRIGLLAAIMIVGAILVPTPFIGSAYAQKVYTPDHPEVREMAWQAMEALGSAGGDHEVQTLQALAIVECYKRYEGRVPMEHPKVTGACESIAAAVDSDGEIMHNHEMYYPCLALILLLEVDDVKYKPQIIKMLQMVKERQLSSGAYTYLRKDVPDTSQTQYAALALYVARQHRFNFDSEIAKNILQSYVDYQAGNGSWDYTPRKGTPVAAFSLSIHSASSGSVYLLSDLLQLSGRAKSMRNRKKGDDGLPPSVQIYVPPKAGNDTSWQSEGPVVQFSGAALNECKRKANAFYEQNFRFPEGRWNYYYMYAFERYAFFREQADGNVGRGTMATWYDQGVEYLKTQRQDNGLFAQGNTPRMTPPIVTPLAIMFLVRSSQVLSQPPRDSVLAGGEGFDEDVELKLERGVMQSNKAEQSLTDLLNALKDENLSNDQLRTLTASMRRAVKEFKTSGAKSRGETKSFLVNMIGTKNYFRRLVAVRMLAGEQDMDNVPALLYALGDPDIRIAREAHDGLRLISRKVDTVNFVDRGDKDQNLAQMISLKKKWTDWYLKIRPDADLFD